MTFPLFFFFSDGGFLAVRFPGRLKPRILTMIKAESTLRKVRRAQSCLAMLSLCDPPHSPQTGTCFLLENINLLSFEGEGCQSAFKAHLKRR